MKEKPKSQKGAPSLAREWKIVSIRESICPESMLKMENPQDAVNYWNAHVISATHFNPDCECMVVLVLNSQQRIRGHAIISIGTLNAVQARPREVFRLAVIAAADTVVLMHNHPSGEVVPSVGDKRLTKIMREAGEIIGIKIWGHIIVGHERYFSFHDSKLLYED